MAPGTSVTWLRPKIQFHREKNAVILFMLNVWRSVTEEILKALGCDFTG